MITPTPITGRVSKWGEGPVWNGDRLLYVDIEKHLIIAFHPATGGERAWNVGQRVGTVVPRACGGLVWAGDTGIYALDEFTGESTLITDPEPGLIDNRFNDGKCDPAGRFWAGTMSLKKQPTGALYCLHADHSIEKKLSPATTSNGIVWTRDTRTMYYIDTPVKKVRAFDFDNATGAITNERIAWDTGADPASPDGMAIDSEDRLWIAFCHGAKVVCFNPATQKVETQIDFPCSGTTACAFGGSDLGDLFVTTGCKAVEEPGQGRLYVCRPGATGVPASAFAG